MCSSHKQAGMAKVFCDVFCSLCTAFLEHSISYIGRPSLVGQGTKPGYAHGKLGLMGPPWKDGRHMPAGPAQITFSNNLHSFSFLKLLWLMCYLQMLLNFQIRKFCMIFRKLSQTVDLSSISRHCCLYCLPRVEYQYLYMFFVSEEKVCALNCLAQVCIILILLDKAYLYFIPLTYLKIFLNWYLVNTIKISALLLEFIYFHPCSFVSLPLFQDFITNRVTIYFF